MLFEWVGPWVLVLLAIVTVGLVVVGVVVVGLGVGFVFEVGGWVSNRVWLAVQAIAVAI